MKSNRFFKQYDGSEAAANGLFHISDDYYVAFYGFGHDESMGGAGYRWRKDYDHRPTVAEVKADIEALINEQVQERIRNGMRYDTLPVYLSEENQLNFRSAPTVPVRYKIGELADGTSAYCVFETREELAEFNEAIANHIAQCLNAGWNEKDAVDYSVYEIV